jgi:hypothetical protein
MAPSCLKGVVVLRPTFFAAKSLAYPLLFEKGVLHVWQDCSDLPDSMLLSAAIHGAKLVA